MQEALSRNDDGLRRPLQPAGRPIEIAYYADTFVVLHEAAHAWFDGTLLADRWASEGFASWYALQAAKAIGEKKVIGDPLTPALEKVRIPLNAWARARPRRHPTTVEDAEYAAALRLAAVIAERAGPDGLQPRLAGDRTTARAAYQPTGAAGEPRATDGPPGLARPPRPPRGPDGRRR